MLYAMPYEKSAIRMRMIPPSELDSSPTDARPISRTPTNPTPTPISCWRGGSFPEHHGRDEGGEEWRRAVEHPGDRRRDVPLGEGEHRERDRHPRRAEQEQARPVRSVDLPAGRRQERQRAEAEGDAQGGDQRRGECVEPDRDEQEGRTPDPASGAEKTPVEWGEGIRVRPLRSREDTGAGHAVKVSGRAHPPWRVSVEPRCEGRVG